MFLQNSQPSTSVLSSQFKNCIGAINYNKYRDLLPLLDKILQFLISKDLFIVYYGDVTLSIDDVIICISVSSGVPFFPMEPPAAYITLYSQSEIMY